jgi:hypothetical protein
MTIKKKFKHQQDYTISLAEILVSFMIDTFGDKQSAYKFAVAASGVKMDSRLT